MAGLTIKLTTGQQEKKKLILYIHDTHKNMRSEDDQAIEAYMCHPALRNVIKAWGFKGENGNSQEDRREDVW